MAAATPTNASRKGALAAMFLTLGTVVSGCSGGANFGASNNQVFYPTGRVMIVGDFVHAYHDTAGRRIALDRYTYEEYGPQGGKLPTIGRCYFQAAVAYTERYLNYNDRANQRRTYPVRAGFVEGRCSNFTSDFMPVGRFDY